MGNWTNNDGLYIKFGTTEGTVTSVGEFNSLNGLHIVEVVIPDMTAISTTAGTRIGSETVTLPVGARIQEVEVITETVVTGVNAVLNLGLQRTDRSTELDNDGLIAAIPTTSMDTAGETTVLRATNTYAGALIGTTLAFAGYFVADYDTAAFTAGKVRIRVKYLMTTTSSG